VLRSCYCLYRAVLLVSRRASALSVCATVLYCTLLLLLQHQITSSNDKECLGTYRVQHPILPAPGSRVDTLS
jgi:hypothetical protein